MEKDNKKEATKPMEIENIERDIDNSFQHYIDQLPDDSPKDQWIVTYINDVDTIDRDQASSYKKDDADLDKG